MGCVGGLAFATLHLGTCQGLRQRNMAFPWRQIVPPMTNTSGSRTHISRTLPSTQMLGNAKWRVDARAVSGNALVAWESELKQQYGTALHCSLG